MATDREVAVVWDILVKGGWKPPHVPSDAVTAAIQYIRYGAVNALTLDQFRATRRRVDSIGEAIGVDDHPWPGYLYADDTCYIDLARVDSSGLVVEEPYLTIWNSQWSGKTLEELEEVLYREYYLPEIAPN